MSIKGAGDPVQAAIHSRPQQLQLLGYIFPLLDGAAVKEDEGRGHAINGNGERAVGARIDRFILPILPKSKDIADGEPAEVHGRVVADPDLPSIGMALAGRERSEEHTSELQSLMRISYAVFCLKKKKNKEN